MAFIVSHIFSVMRGFLRQAKLSKSKYKNKLRSNILYKNLGALQRSLCAIRRKKLAGSFNKSIRMDA